MSARVPALGRRWGSLSDAERELVPVGTVLCWPQTGRVVVKSGDGRWRDGSGDIHEEDELSEDRVIEYYP